MRYLSQLMMIYTLGQIFFISSFTNPPTVIFWKVEKKKIISKIIFFYPQTLDIIRLVEKK